MGKVICVILHTGQSRLGKGWLHSHCCQEHPGGSAVTTLRLLCGFSYIHTLSYTESNCIHVVGGYKMPYTGPNTSIYSIICTYYLQLPVTEIHPLHSPPPDCSAVSNLNRRATKSYPLGGYQKIEKM